MYTPNHFRIDDLEKLHELMVDNNFATLVTQQDGRPFATHLPFRVDTEDGQFGVLRTHVARANPQWQDIGGDEVLVIFQGAHAYISPTWYASTPMVPTWNYAAVHAYGRARIVDDAALQQILEQTVAQYDPSWNIDLLPVDFVEKMRRAIVGIEIEITRLEGKLKMGQNHSVADRAGAIAGLRSTGDPLSIAVAEIMESLIANHQ